MLHRNWNWNWNWNLIFVVVIHLPSADLFMIKIELVGFLYSKEEQVEEL